MTKTFKVTFNIIFTSGFEKIISSVSEIEDDMVDEIKKYYEEFKTFIANAYKENMTGSITIGEAIVRIEDTSLIEITLEKIKD